MEKIECLVESIKEIFEFDKSNDQFYKYELYFKCVHINSKGFVVKEIANSFPKIGEKRVFYIKNKDYNNPIQLKYFKKTSFILAHVFYVLIIYLIIYSEL